MCAIAAGEVSFGPGVAARVLDQLTRPPAIEAPAGFPDPTVRELEVLDLLAAGLPTGTIAQRLGLISKTVNNHVSNILAKLHVADRTQAAMERVPSDTSTTAWPGRSRRRSLK